MMAKITLQDHCPIGNLCRVGRKSKKLFEQHCAHSATKNFLPMNNNPHYYHRQTCTNGPLRQSTVYKCNNRGGRILPWPPRMRSSKLLQRVGASEGPPLFLSQCHPQLSFHGSWQTPLPNIDSLTGSVWKMYRIIKMSSSWVDPGTFRKNRIFPSARKTAFMMWRQTLPLSSTPLKPVL
jgi:hypothetical protein